MRKDCRCACAGKKSNTTTLRRFVSRHSVADGNSVFVSHGGDSRGRPLLEKITGRAKYIRARAFHGTHLPGRSDRPLHGEDLDGRQQRWVECRRGASPSPTDQERHRTRKVSRSCIGRQYRGWRGGLQSPESYFWIYGVCLVMCETPETWNSCSPSSHRIGRTENAGRDTKTL